MPLAYIQFLSQRDNYAAQREEHIVVAMSVRLALCPAD